MLPSKSKRQSYILYLPQNKDNTYTYTIESVEEKKNRVVNQHAVKKAFCRFYCFWQIGLDNTKAENKIETNNAKPSPYKIITFLYVKFKIRKKSKTKKKKKNEEKKKEDEVHE